MNKSNEIKNIIKDYSDEELQVLDKMCYGKSLDFRLGIVTMFDVMKNSSGHFGWRRTLKKLDEKYEPSLTEKYARYLVGDGPHPFGEDID